MSKIWTEAEEKYLIENYSNANIEEMQEKFGVDTMTIRRKVTRLRKKGYDIPDRKIDWPNKDEEYLFQNYGVIPTDEICKKLNKSRSSIYKKIWELRKEKGIEICPEWKWTEEKDNYLRENWGTYTVGHFAKKFKKTELAVIARATRLGLGSFSDNVPNITFCELLRELGYKGFDERIYKLWKNAGFPFLRKKINKKYRIYVNMDKFWDWVKDNQPLINLSKLEKNVLGIEPDWADERRKSDKKRKTRRLQWSEKDLSHLKSLLELNRYNAKELAEKFNTTRYSIYCTISSNKFPKSVRCEVEPWNDDDTYKAIKMYLNGKKNFEIAMELGVDTQRVRSKINNLTISKSDDYIRRMTEYYEENKTLKNVHKFLKENENEDYRAS